MSYCHVNLTERHCIQVSRKDKMSQSKIAQAPGRSQSTISRELKRNSGRKGYRHKQADSFAHERHGSKRKAVKMTEEMRHIVSVCLLNDWSPEQTAGRLREEGVLPAHHETICQYVLADKKNGGQLCTHLRHQRKTYRKRCGSAHNRTGIPDRRDIDGRPVEVNTRERVGDWEADTMTGKNHKGAVITLDERKSKLRLAAPLPGKKAKYVKEAIITLLSPVKQFVETITFDNGKEFALHKEIAKEIECGAYFAKPYHSWERGRNENANGLLRQYFSKSMELLDVTAPNVLSAVDKLNSRPRKCLNFQTPYEVFEKWTGVDVRKIMGYALIT